MAFKFTADDVEAAYKTANIEPMQCEWWSTKRDATMDTGSRVCGCGLTALIAATKGVEVASEIDGTEDAAEVLEITDDEAEAFIEGFDGCSREWSHSTEQCEAWQAGRDSAVRMGLMTI